MSLRTVTRLTRLTAGSLPQRARRWPEESQLRARRNAMVAATALAQRRAEHDEVEAYLAALRLQRTTAAPPTAEARAGHG